MKAKGDNIEDRLIDFAVRIIGVCVMHCLISRPAGIFADNYCAVVLPRRPIMEKHVGRKAAETLSINLGLF